MIKKILKLNNKLKMIKMVTKVHKIKDKMEVNKTKILKVNNNLLKIMDHKKIQINKMVGNKTLNHKTNLIKNHKLNKIIHNKVHKMKEPRVLKTMVMEIMA